MSFVGAFIPVRDLICLKCIAVARHPRHEFDVDDDGIVHELQEDRNVKIIIPPFTFPYSTTISTTVNIISNTIQFNSINSLFKVHV